MDIYSVRRENLTGLIRDKFESNRAAFCRTTGRHPNLINLVLSKNPEFQRNIGEKLARMIEADMSLPEGWMDAPHQSLSNDTVQFRVVELDGQSTTEKLQVTLPRLDRPTSLDAVVAVRMPSSEFAPQLLPQDLLLVDTGQKTMGPDGLYVVKAAGGHFVRRVSKLITGGFRLATSTDSADVKKVEPVGRVVGTVLFRSII